MLNLQASGASRSRELITEQPTSLSDPSDNSTTLLFTSRISMPPTTTWDQEASRYRESVYVRDTRSGYGHGHIEEAYEMQDTHAADDGRLLVHDSLEGPKAPRHTSITIVERGR